MGDDRGRDDCSDVTGRARERALRELGSEQRKQRGHREREADEPRSDARARLREAHRRPDLDDRAIARFQTQLVYVRIGSVVRRRTRDGAHGVNSMGGSRESTAEFKCVRGVDAVAGWL